jgi:CBS domain containing-hemolysin-like protein
MAEAAPAHFVSALAAHSGQVVLVLCCMLALAFSSLAEAALMRTDLPRARQLAAEGRWGAGSLLWLAQHRQEVLSTLILIINVSVIAASAYATELTINLSGGATRWVPVTSIVMVLALLVFCELTPKTYAVRRSERVALACAPGLQAIHAVVNPFGRLLHLAGLAIIRRVLVPLFGGRPTTALPTYSDEEVLEMVSQGEAAGDIEAEEKEMIHGVIEFADKVVREVMTPRTDMVCVPASASLMEAASVSKESGHSRLPVYVEDVDHIIGILYAKDMVAALERDATHLTAAQLARKPAPVVPESRKLDQVLRLMQRNRLHMAIVIDEYGGTAGLVTIEDLLEEIFGEIQDEHDFEAEPIMVVDANTLVVDARVGVDQVEEELGVKLPEGEFDSIGGFVLDQLGRLPSAGEKVVWQNLEFTVQDVSENRIKTVRIARTPAAPPTPEEDDHDPREARAEDGA